MSLVLQNPWSVVARFHNDLNRAAQPARASSTGERDLQAYDWIPGVDVIEERERFVVIANVPGVALEAIEITADDGMLAIRGERKEDSREGRSVKRAERMSGRFYRRFELPEGIDTDRIEARCDNGVLEISIPKVEKTKARRIEVRH